VNPAVEQVGVCWYFC